MHHESPNPNRGLPRGAAGETAPPPLNWQQSSAQKAVSQLTEKEERIVTATIHFLRTESDICSLLHSAVSTVKYVTKSLPWGDASIFSWSYDWPFLVSVNCDVPEAYNFEFGVICFWMYWKTALWILIEIHSVKRELPKSSILYTSHTEDEYWRYEIINLAKRS